MSHAKRNSDPQHLDLRRLLSDAQASLHDDTPAMNEIIRRFDGLAHRLAARMTRNHHLQQDLANAARISLVRAVRRHDLRQPAFPAYAERYMRGAVFREFQRWVIPQETAIDPETLLVDAVEAVEMADAIIERIAPFGGGRLADVVDALAPDQKTIMQLRFVEDAPLDVIAAATGTTASAVSQRITTIKRQITKALAA